VNNVDDENYNEHGDMNTEEESFAFASGDGSAHLLAFIANYAELFYDKQHFFVVDDSIDS